MKIDEVIAKYKEITNTDAICPAHCNIPCEKCVQESEQFVEWLEKLKTIESIMLTYNANWYADEDNGVPDCEVLESIWNVIQDNGLDIDIEQDYRKGKADGYNKAIDDIKEKLMKNGFIYTQHALDVFNEIAEQLKAGIKNRAYHKVKKIVQEVEEEYNSSWIPCSERLPKKEKKTYWVCTDTEYQCECRWTNNRFGFGEGEWGWSIFDTPQYSKPIAWMPLPEPFKERD